MRYLMILLLLLSATLKAQDWQPFILDQPSYYRYTSFGTEKTTLLLMDSVNSSGNSGTYYFKRKIIHPAAPFCRDTLINHYSSQIFQADSGEFDRLTFSNDTLFFNTDNWFLPKASPGDSWWILSHSIQMTCDSVRYDSIAGTMDSLKYFHTGGAIGNLPIVLSKSFGFVNYLAYNTYSLQPEIRELAGIQNVWGFQPPLWQDYFPYQTGDILSWRQDNSYLPGMPFVSTYIRDSITDVQLNADSIVLTYDQTSEISDGSVSQSYGIQTTYYRNVHGYLLESPAADVAPTFLYPNYTLEFLVYSAQTYDTWNDTVRLTPSITRMFTSDFSPFISDSCVFESILDGTQLTLHFNSHLGMTYYAEDGIMEAMHKSLIGARLGNYQYNTTPILNSILPLNSMNFKISPNPAKDYIRIENASEGDLHLTILDHSGKSIHSQKLTEHCQTIDLHSYSAGTYLIRLMNDRGEMYSKKFIKLDD